LYLNRGPLLEFFKLVKNIFLFLNKYFYIIAIIQTLSIFTNNKFNKFISKLIKIFLFLNIIFGVGYFIYLTDFVNSYNSLYEIYYNILNPYIEIIKNLWNDVIHNSIIEDSFIENSNNIKKQIKEGMKEGVKEALDEALNQMHDDEVKTNTLKNIAFFTSIVFFVYFIFVLPDSTVTSEVVNQYNWFNHALIEFKIDLINFLNNFKGNGGNGGENIGNSSPISPTNTNLTDTPTQGFNNLPSGSK